MGRVVKGRKEAQSGSIYRFFDAARRSTPQKNKLRSIMEFRPVECTTFYHRNDLPRQTSATIRDDIARVDGQSFNLAYTRRACN